MPSTRYERKWVVVGQAVLTNGATTTVTPYSWDAATLSAWAQADVIGVYSPDGGNVQLNFGGTAAGNPTSQALNTGGDMVASMMGLTTEMEQYFPKTIMDKDITTEVGKWVVPIASSVIIFTFYKRSL